MPGHALEVRQDRFSKVGESEEHLKVLSNVQGSRRPAFDLLFRCDYLRHVFRGSRPLD